MSAENQPIRGFVALTAGGGDAAKGRLFIVNATVAGNVVITALDGSTHTIAVAVGYSAFPYAVKNVASATATATYANGI